MSDEEKAAAIRRLESIGPDDQTYLIKNMQIVNGFFREAHKVRDASRQHYSARTIIEYLRHYSTLEDSGTLFKINDHLVPKLARASMELFPFLNNLFELRSAKSE